MIEILEDIGCEYLCGEYKNAKTKFKFTCIKHRDYGVQETACRNILKRRACHICGKEHSKYSRTLPKEELQKLTESKGFIFVDVTYKSGKCEIIYKCQKHLDKGVFLSTPGNMRSSKGNCPYCLHRMRTHEDFVSELKKINPNILILPDAKYKTVHSKVKCKCLICGYEWEGICGNLLHGSGCKRCATEKTISYQSHSHNWFLEQMCLIHPDINVLSPFKSMKTIVRCRCNVDGNEWITTPDSLLNRKSGCRICSNRTRGILSRKSNEEFVYDLSMINPNIYPLEPYITYDHKIKCLCRVHNYVWMVSPSKLLRQPTGCPKCNMYSNEVRISSLLDSWGFQYETQKRFPDCKDINTLPFDFFLTDFNTVIEYDGEGHYKPIFRSSNKEKDILAYETCIKHDRIKDEYCSENSIHIIRIPYWESKNLESFLFSKLLELNIISPNL